MSTVASPSYRWERIVGEADPTCGYAPRPDAAARLTVEALRALKARWYAEAAALEELAYLHDLGRTLGEDVNATDFQREWDRDFDGDPDTDTSRRLQVFVDGKGGCLTVKVGGQLVCSTHDTERLFVPGRWLLATRSAAADLAEVRQLREQEREAAQTGRLRQELGLPPSAPAAGDLAVDTDPAADRADEPARLGLYSALARSGQ